MFELDWGKLVVIGIVALIVIGPKELPTVLRTLGQWVTKIRRMASEFQGQFQEAMREAEIADLKKQVDSMSDVAHGVSTDFTSTARTTTESDTVTASPEPPPVSAEAAPSESEQTVTAPSVQVAADAPASHDPAPSGTAETSVPHDHNSASSRAGGQAA